MCRLRATVNSQGSSLVSATSRWACFTSRNLVPMFVGFASLTVAWLLVAVGMGRQGARQ